jgi:hypothetical protein
VKQPILKDLIFELAIIQHIDLVASTGEKRLISGTGNLHMNYRKNFCAVPLTGWEKRKLQAFTSNDKAIPSMDSKPLLEYTNPEH